MCNLREGVVLQMKSMGIDKVVSFPIPTPPDMIGLKEAHRVLPPPHFTHSCAISLYSKICHWLFTDALLSVPPL
jgi:hypothetical protein